MLLTAQLPNVFLQKLQPTYERRTLLVLEVCQVSFQFLLEFRIKVFLTGSANQKISEVRRRLEVNGPDIKVIKLFFLLRH